MISRLLLGINNSCLRILQFRYRLLRVSWYRQGIFRYGLLRVFRHRRLRGVFRHEGLLRVPLHRRLRRVFRYKVLRRVFWHRGLRRVSWHGLRLVSI